MSDLLSTSASTWSDHTDDAPVVDARLRPPADASWGERLSAWRTIVSRCLVVVGQIWKQPV